MVLPQECALIQDPATLEPERLTHAFLQGGRHMVIRDYWQDARASRQLDEQWHGAVIFASNQHVVVNTSGSVSNQPVIADGDHSQSFHPCFIELQLGSPHHQAQPGQTLLDVSSAMVGKELMTRSQHHVKCQHLKVCHLHHLRLCHHLKH